MNRITPKTIYALDIPAFAAYIKTILYSYRDSALKKRGCCTCNSPGVLYQTADTDHALLRSDPLLIGVHR